ncbi:hypothetical protein fugu_006745 [Takifugu bimaculatus]|uniref:Deoxyribonuclease n=1 Tax=Takifugu bimaculatus TaxID=433685 RepID=A0A4Z2B3F0_9TELE|nr:hypothetical protein fugu_006745 [Takifugu bimaculatus]
MAWRPRCLSLLLLLAVVGQAASQFRICAYNLQEFNKMKASNYRVKNLLMRVLSRCHISVLQEVMDPDGSTMKSLLASLNSNSARYEDHQYQMVSSKPLGNSPNRMQQYVFIYRSRAANVTGQFQYQKAQTFIRAPFAVQFQSGKTAIKKFVLVAVNTQPEQTVQEIDRLHDVFQAVSSKFNNKNVMFLGNFHAGCAYMTRADKKRIRLFKDLNFSWLIGDKVDTTVAAETSCAYDRIVVYGKGLLKSVQPFSAKVFNVNKAFKLHRDMVRALSDHFPIEVMLKSSAHLLQALSHLTLIGISVIVCSCLPAL